MRPLSPFHRPEMNAVGSSSIMSTVQLGTLSPSTVMQCQNPHSTNIPLSHENVRLHDDSMPRGHPYDPDSLVDSDCSSVESSHEPEFLAGEDAATPEAESKRVHFRPRVRIASGIRRHRHRHVHSPRIPRSRTYRGRFLSPHSSRSSSPSASSSISVPLRASSDDQTYKPGWVPLGQRPALLSDSRQQSREKRAKRYRMYPTEETPLLYTQCLDGQDNYPQELSREIDMYFGPWPQRLLNHHWWWWQLEPVVCCHCLDESDAE